MITATPPGKSPKPRQIEPVGREPVDDPAHASEVRGGALCIVLVTL
jgi:hypothetical protein